MKYSHVSIIAIFALMFLGCAHKGPSQEEKIHAEFEYIKDQRVANLKLANQVAIGMSKAEVTSLLGIADTSNVTRTATSVNEQWVYTGKRLVASRAGADEAVNYSWKVKLYYGGDDQRFYFYFVNGTLTTTQGF
jgi:hypothetical protein